MVLLLLPFVFSFNCQLTNDPVYCQNITNSNLTESQKDKIYSSLLYNKSIIPDYSFVEKYNTGIIVNFPPDNTTVYNSHTIRSAWLSLLAIFPSVYENKTLYVPIKTKALSEFHYYVYVPLNYQSPYYPHTSQGDCRRTYQLIQNEAKLKYYFNNQYQDNKKFSNISINSDGKIKVKLDIDTNIKVDHYQWNKYCCKWYGQKCKKYCYTCDYWYSNYQPDHINISGGKEVEYYKVKPTANLRIINQYYNTTKGILKVNNYAFFKLSFNNSYLTFQNHYYDLVFDKKPYYLAYLRSHNFTRVTQNNVYLDQNTFYVKNTDQCNLFAFNHFYNFTSGCNLTVNQEKVDKLNINGKNADLNLLFYLLTFILLIYLIYRLARSQFKKIIIPVLLILLLCVPVVIAASPQQQKECGITNIASCLPEKIYEYILVVINAPLLPLLLAVQKLLTAEPSIDIFHGVWSVIRYILSFFYIFLFIYAGSVFLVSNADPVKRAYAKDMLKDAFLMIILIQASFYIYDVVLSLSTILNSGIINLIDPKFFMLTADNIVNIGLQFVYAGSYLFTLLITSLMLVLRYIVACFGVVIFPLALFCYFIPPLRSYGKFLLHLLGIFIFITFFDLLIILACSMIIKIPLFANTKIMVMIVCFLIIDYTLWLSIKFTLKRSAFSGIKQDIQQAAKYIKMVI